VATALSPFVEDGVDLPFLHECAQLNGMLVYLILGTPAALLELGPTGGMDQMKTDILARCSAEQFDRDGHHPEAYGPRQKTSALFHSRATLSTGLSTQPVDKQ
jgi:hypothetical protein